MADFIATAWDEDGNPVDGYYEDAPGDNYSNEGDNYAYAGENYSNEGRNRYDVDPVGAQEDEYTAETRRLAEMNAGDRGLGGISPDESGGFNFGSIAKQLGLTDANDQYNLSRILALAGTGVGLVGAATAQPGTIRSLSELRAGMPALNTPAGWTQAELDYGMRPMQTGSALQRIYAAGMPSPVTPGKTAGQYAEGGEVEAPGALSQAFSGGVRGADGGQSDLISINVSGGEYVMDADSVSALGDGNTEAGIAKLDELREQLRAQKRAAPTDEIPPQAQGPLSYIQGA